MAGLKDKVCVIGMGCSKFGEFFDKSREAWNTFQLTQCSLVFRMDKFCRFNHDNILLFKNTLVYI